MLFINRDEDGGKRESVGGLGAGGYGKCKEWIGWCLMGVDWFVRGAG